MDRFIQLEPDGGFRAVVALARRHGASTPNTEQPGEAVAAKGLPDRLRLFAVEST